MSNIHRIEYKPKDYGHAEIYVDGKRIKCSRFSFEHDVDSIPYAEIEVNAKSDIKALADIGLRLRIDDIDSAIMCLKFAFMMDDKFREMISGMLRDEIDDEDTVQAVAERLLGT